MEIGNKIPNELGLFDMSGNVFEWCSDWYDEEYYSTSPENNPEGPVSGFYHVIRGGSWHYYTTSCRIVNRSYRDPSGRPSEFFDHVGFRVVFID